jgi:flagella basal body P-ring formation protein FlgA
MQGRHFMQRFKCTFAMAFASGIAFIAASANAAEIRLRSGAHATGSVVRLGEVADIFDGTTGEIQALQQIELAPAPSVGKQRAITVREVQDTLERRGLNMVFHRISGASQVLVAPADNAPKPVARQKLLPMSSVQVAQRAVNDAIVKCLQEATGSDEPWTIETDLTTDQAQAVLADVHNLKARGGSEPWIGKQSFEIAVQTDRGPAAFAVEAKVSAPSAVVVTLQTVPRGTIVQACDVALQRVKPGTYVDDAFRSLDDVIGREAVRAMAPGQIVDPQYVRMPTLVKRGSVVTVYVKSPGVRIRTTGKARTGGGEGETITVESLLDRKSFEARIVGIDQVEVNADPIAATASPATELPRLPVAAAAKPRGNGQYTVRRATATLPVNRGNE